jgi:hypothetical protein
MNVHQKLFTDSQIGMTTSEMCHPVKTEFDCHWLTDSDSWDKSRFSSEVVLFIEQTQGGNAFPNLILIGMLTHQIDLYVQCTRQIAKSGLLETYNKGVTSGPSLYFSMADKALNRILQIMKELGLTPKHRVGTVRSTNSDALEFERFMAGSV